MKRLAACVAPADKTPLRCSARLCLLATNHTFTSRCEIESFGISFHVLGLDQVAACPLFVHARFMSQPAAFQIIHRGPREEIHGSRELQCWPVFPAGICQCDSFSFNTSIDSSFDCSVRLKRRLPHDRRSVWRFRPRSSPNSNSCPAIVIYFPGALHRIFSNMRGFRFEQEEDSPCVL